MPEQQQPDRLRRFATIVSVVVGGIAIMSAAWKIFLAPALIAAVTAAVAGDLQTEVERVVAAQVAPINAGLKASIQSAASQFEDDIAALEYRQQLRDGTWTAEDAQRLTNKRRRLSEQLRALAAIEAAERGR